METLREEDRQREPLGHMTSEVNVHAGKEKEKKSNLLEAFWHSLPLPFFKPTHSSSLTLSLFDAAFFSMEAMRRKQV